MLKPQLVSVIQIYLKGFRASALGFEKGYNKRHSQKIPKPRMLNIVIHEWVLFLPYLYSQV